MNEIYATIKCNKCETAFQPDIKTGGAWVCPSCKGKNPNLKRHYRSVTNLCILGFVSTIFFTLVNMRGLDLYVFISIAYAALLLVTIIFIYKSKTPWTDATAKILIWASFGLGLGIKLIIRTLFVEVIIYAIIFPYLFWLNSQAEKCKPLPPSTSTNMEKTQLNRGSSIALIYLFSWGLYGLFMAIGLVFALSYEWAKVSGVGLDDIPAGIMYAGSYGGIIALLFCPLAGLSISIFRAKKWNRKSVILSGVLGPGIGIAGGVLGLLLKNPILLFILFVVGLPIGVNLGRILGERKDS